MHPEIYFCYGGGVGKCLLSFGEQILIPLPCLPLILPNARRSTHGFEGSLRTSSSGSCSSSALAHLPAVDSTWMSLCPPCCCSWPVGCQSGSCSGSRALPPHMGDVPPLHVLRLSDSCTPERPWRLILLWQGWIIPWAVSPSRDATMPAGCVGGRVGWGQQCFSRESHGTDKAIPWGGGGCRRSPSSLSESCSQLPCVWELIKELIKLWQHGAVLSCTGCTDGSGSRAACHRWGLTLNLVARGDSGTAAPLGHSLL